MLDLHIPETNLQWSSSRPNFQVGASNPREKFRDASEYLESEKLGINAISNSDKLWEVFYFRTFQVENCWKLQTTV